MFRRIRALRRATRLLFLGVCALGAIGTGGPGGGLSAQPLDLGYTDGKRSTISRGPDWELPVPDVLTLRDGRRLEVYFLEPYGEKVVFYLQEGERFWVRRVVPRSAVAEVERGQHLERDPLSTLAIRRSRKQPARKSEVLAGEFVGRQGRFTRWHLSFHSEIDKTTNFSEDATEFGRFTARSYTSHDTGSSVRAHETSAWGQYFVYAPGTVNNEDWVLALTNVLQNETDLSPRRTLDTTSIARETYIVACTVVRGPGGFEPIGAFELAWANIGSGLWGALTSTRFSRVPARAPARDRDGHELAKSRSSSRESRRAGDGQQRGVDAALNAEVVSERPRKKKRRRWRIRNWGKPVSRWGR